MPESPIFWGQKISWQLFWIRNFGERFHTFWTLRPKKVLFVLKGKKKKKNFLNIFSILMYKLVRTQGLIWRNKRVDTFRTIIFQIFPEQQLSFLAVLLYLQQTSIAATKNNPVFQMTGNWSTETTEMFSMLKKR